MDLQVSPSPFFILSFFDLKREKKKKKFTFASFFSGWEGVLSSDPRNGSDLEVVYSKKGASLDHPDFLSKCVFRVDSSRGEEAPGMLFCSMFVLFCCVVHLQVMFFFFPPPPPPPPHLTLSFLYYHHKKAHL
jgi:hypothetical protein